MINPKDIPPDNLPVVDDSELDDLFGVQRRDDGSGSATPSVEPFRVSKRGQAELGDLLKKHCHLDLAVDSHEMKVAVENLMQAYVFMLKLAERSAARKAKEEQPE